MKSLNNFVYNQKLHMHPVPLREFHARLRMIRNEFDLLRIFIANKDISDSNLKDLLRTRIVPTTNSVLTNDIKKREEQKETFQRSLENEDAYPSDYDSDTGSEMDDGYYNDDKHVDSELEGEKRVSGMIEKYSELLFSDRISMSNMIICLVS